MREKQAKVRVDKATRSMVEIVRALHRLDVYQRHRVLRAALLMAHGDNLEKLLRPDYA